MTTLRTLVPVVRGGLNATYEQAPAVRQLEGATVALLDNNKKNATHFLNYVEEVLRTDYGVGDVVRLLKRNLSAPAPAEVLQKLRGCDAMFTAIGD